jgi:predicted  nucleic acid-binding Zn-ribbon protein|tara:strand:+ start:204 stop:461 length:258 start_codon:yes stop_codon:yes gene_type:complete
MIKEKKVLTEEEIKELKELKTDFDSLIYSLGTVEAEINVLENTKIDIKKRLVDLTNKEKLVAKKLEDKYGAGKLSLDTGEIQPLQ